MKLKKLLYKMLAKFLTAFGNIKVFKFPLFMVYDPSDYKVDGNHLQTAVELIQPGDVVLRGYDHYLDGYFIDDPYGYSHGGLYIGNRKMIHAVAEGVSEINVLDFMSCDRVCILRPTKGQKAAIKQAKQFLKDSIPYDFSFSHGKNALYCFELCAEAYSSLNIKRVQVKKLFGLLKKDAFLADSFRKNQNFDIVFEFNPRHDVDICKKARKKR